MPIQNVYLTMFKNRWNMLTLLVEQWHKKTLLGWDPLIFFANRIFFNLFLNSQISLSLNSKCKVSPFQGHFFFFLIGCYYIYGWITFASFIWAFIVKWWFCITNFFFCISSPPMFRLNSTISVLSLQIQQMYKHRYIYRDAAYFYSNLVCSGKYKIAF